MGDLKITLTKSLIGQKPSIRKTAIALGLKKPNRFVIRRDSPYIRGMIKKLYFMVKVEEL